MFRIATLAVWLSLAAWAGDSQARVEYVGGTLASLKSNSDGRLDLTGAGGLILCVQKTTTEVPYERINMLEYGQKVDRRLVEALLISPLILLAKKRKHFLTVGFADQHGQQQAMVLRVDKRHVRAVLVGLEAKTGRKVEYQDEEARRAGKG